MADENLDESETRSGESTGKKNQFSLNDRNNRPGYASTTFSDDSGYASLNTPLQVLGRDLSYPREPMVNDDLSVPPSEQLVEPETRSGESFGDIYPFGLPRLHHGKSDSVGYDDIGYESLLHAPTALTGFPAPMTKDLVHENERQIHEIRIRENTTSQKKARDALENEFAEMVKQRNGMLTSERSRPSHPSPINSPILEDCSGSDNGMYTDSEISECAPDSSPESDAWLTVAYAKHRLMVSLMREVYTISISQWRSEFRSRPESQTGSTGASLQYLSSRTPSSTAKGKGKMDDEGSHSPDGNDDKKRRSKSANSEDAGKRKLFACCFYKYNTLRYCVNTETGTKYRSCAGPGFGKISQLKQHLKRKHPAQIYCPRCWLVMKSQAELALHANAEERCEQNQPRVLEGIDDDKMRMITGTWGVSWEGIYEILFPGAPVPSPYYEADDIPPEHLGQSSPQSQEITNFEVYSRTALPLLVEASLRPIMESHFAPMREMVIDVVRTCQSTVARNYHSMIASSSSVNDQIELSSQGTASVEAARQPREEPTEVMADGTRNTLDFFSEPPYLNAAASASSLGPTYSHNSVPGGQNHTSDSGYSSLPYNCICSCHYSSNTWDTANNPSNCQSCAYMHDGLDLDTLDSLYDDFGLTEHGNGPQA